MLKRLIAAMLIVFSLASLSYAKIVDLGAITVDLPTGWIAEKSNDFNYVFRKSDRTAAIMFDISNLGGMEPKEAISEFAKKLEGSTPVYNEKKNEYTFTYRNTDGIVFNVSSTPFVENDAVVTFIWAEVDRTLLEKIISSITFK